MPGNGKEELDEPTKPYDQNLNPHSEAGISQRRHKERWDRIASAIEPMGYVSVAGDLGPNRQVEEQEE